MRQRDPRGWTATFAYFALIASDALVLKEGANAEEVAWWQIKGKHGGDATGLRPCQDCCGRGVAAAQQGRIYLTARPFAAAQIHAARSAIGL